ncbi:hypothetical protein IKE79_01545, partial [Candidatus Saccharibacteria bacterium]|nr:hypothetical protein [Candidatus Saccharibacteria bacterium]
MAKVILPTPVGQIWNQEMAQRMAGMLVKTTSARAAFAKPVATGGRRSSSPCQAPEALREGVSAMPDTHYIILCPHYEGYDERILSIVDYKISLGKYVLTGGELPALII